jgi:hypothetical protein
VTTITTITITTGAGEAVGTRIREEVEDKHRRSQ